jgi:YHS domain-containing protein
LRIRTGRRHRTVFEQLEVGGGSQGAAAKREYAGKTYYFGGPGCAKAFDLKPEAYVEGSRA